MADASPYLDSAVEHGVLVLTVLHRQIEGEQVAAALKDELQAQVSKHAATRVVLDLGRCRYVSSIAFWPLLALRKQLKEQNGRLLICGLTGAVEEVFTTTKMVSSSGTLDAPFETAPDRESAVARLAGLEPAH